jgi:FixJ family two-component response regulator
MVVDDDTGFLRSLGRMLRRSGYGTLLFPTAEAFEAQHDFAEAVCVLLDIDLGERSGIEVRKQLKARNSSLAVIFMTGNDDPIVRTAALQSGCLACLNKPFPAQALLDLIGEAAAG